MTHTSPKKYARRWLALLLPLCMFMAQAHQAHSQEIPEGPEIFQDAQAFNDSEYDELGAAELPGIEALEAQDFVPFRAWDDPVPRGFGATLTSGLLASGYGLLKNTILMLYNTIVLDEWWTTPTASSIRRNFTVPWRWEVGDGFMVNYLGHPIQGMIYFGAGRATGFSFYGSIFFSVFGSVTWELMFEYAQAAINDLFTTAPAGVSLGEMMFRLYLQAHAAGMPAFLTFLLSPSAALHRLVTRWEPPHVERNFYDFSFHLAAAYGNTDHHISGDMIGGSHREFFHSGPFAAAGFRIIYGDPFVQNTWVPYRHFEFSGTFGTDAFNHVDMRVFSDGYLFSFSPLHTDTQALSTGLSLHMDFASIGLLDMFHATINMYSNAIGWSVKYRHIFSPNISWRARAHASFTFFGASNFYNHFVSERHEQMSYAYGVNLKHLSTLDIGTRSRIDLDNFFFFQWSYPNINALSRGFVWWQFHDVSFSHMVSRNISLGAAFSFAMERGFFEGFPSTSKNYWSARTFVAWNGQSIRGGR